MWSAAPQITLWGGPGPRFEPGTGDLEAGTLTTRQPHLLSKNALPIIWFTLYIIFLIVPSQRFWLCDVQIDNTVSCKTPNFNHRCHHAFKNLNISAKSKLCSKIFNLFSKAQIRLIDWKNEVQESCDTLIYDERDSVNFANILIFSDFLACTVWLIRMLILQPTFANCCYALHTLQNKFAKPQDLDSYYTSFVTLFCMTILRFLILFCTLLFLKCRLYNTCTVYTVLYNTPSAHWTDSEYLVTNK